MTEAAKLPMPTVLIVDDSAPVRSQVESALQSGGYGVLQADSGEAALQLMGSEHPDLLIVDINMPGMGGAELIAEVRALPQHQSTPIFVLTTESDPALIQECRGLGATAWMIKPCNPAALLRGLRRVLGQ